MTPDPLEELRRRNPVAAESLPGAPMDLAARIAGPRRARRAAMAFAAGAAAVLVVGAGAWVLFFRGAWPPPAAVGPPLSTAASQNALGELLPPEGEFLTTCAPRTARGVLAFEEALAAGDRSISAICSRVGAPDWMTGSGLSIYLYDLADGSRVHLGYAGESELVYATRIAADNTQTDLLTGRALCSASGAAALTAQDGLPGAVAATRLALWDAATRCDWEGLGRLAAGGVRFSFGTETDPIGYWQALESQGQQPLQYLVALLDLPYGTVTAGDRTYYAWPSAFTYPSWDRVPAAARDALRPLYDDAALATFAGFGGYYGYRVGILENGDWAYFVAGD